MAQFVNMFEVDLDKRSYPVNLNQTVSEGNVSSNRIGAYVYKDGAAYNLGGNCTGLVMRADGSTVPLTGVIDGNAAYVVLDQPSCAIPGPIQVAVNWVSGSNTTTLVVAYGTVIHTDTRAYIQPGTPIPDIDQLLAEIDNMREATADAEAAATKSVRYDAAQSLTDANKTTARGNIGAADSAEFDTLKSALSDNAFTVNAWENGSISDANGNNINSSERIRLKGFMPITVQRLRSTVAAGRFGVLAYNANGTFVGGWNGSSFSVGGMYFYASIDMSTMYSNPSYAGYKYRVVYRISGGSVQIDTVTGVHLDTYISDFSDIIDDISSNAQNTEKNSLVLNTLNLSGANNINGPELWESGGINTVTGADVASAGRARSKLFIPTNAGMFSMGARSNTRAFYVLAYGITGNYVGAYKKSTDSFVTDGTESGFNTLNKPFDIGSLQARFPSYRFRLAMYVRNSGTDITPSEYSEWTMTSSLNFGRHGRIKVIQYNIGKFNYGHGGGLSQDVSQKIANYKEFFASTNADFLFMQEFVAYIDAAQAYDTDITLFDPIFLYKSYVEKETSIKGQWPLNNTVFSYLHTSGDQPSWCIYGDTDIGGRKVAVVSGVLNVDINTGIDHSEQQIRALTKLTEELLVDYDYAIIGMDTNCWNQTEADTVLAFMKTKGYKSGNWAYLGVKDTYNPASSIYKAIDNVFVKGDMSIVNFTVPDIYASLSSDHFPVIAEIRY